MICPGCRSENPTDNRFCDRCGTPLDTGCPGCGAAPRAGARFCGGCGRRVDAPEPAGAPAVPRAVPAVASYTPRHLAEKILKSRSALEGERRQVTVLFADLAGFTALAERRDPEDVHAIIDRCFEPIAAEIMQVGHTLLRAQAGADRMDDARATAAEVAATIDRLAAAAPDAALRDTFRAWPRVQAAREDAERVRAS